MSIYGGLLSDPGVFVIRFSLKKPATVCFKLLGCGWVSLLWSLVLSRYVDIWIFQGVLDVATAPMVSSTSKPCHRHIFLDVVLISQLWVAVILVFLARKGCYACCELVCVDGWFIRHSLEDVFDLFRLIHGSISFLRPFTDNFFYNLIYSLRWVHRVFDVYSSTLHLIFLYTTFVNFGCSTFFKVDYVVVG